MNSAVTNIRDADTKLYKRSRQARWAMASQIVTSGANFAAEIIEEWSRDDKGRFICVRDVASLMVSIDNPDLVSLHKEAAMVTLDGMPLALIGKLKGLPVERTCGPDLMNLVCARSRSTGLKHYSYGGKEGVAEKLAENFKGKHAGIDIVGYECPPFRPLTLAEDKGCDRADQGKWGGCGVGRHILSQAAGCLDEGSLPAIATDIDRRWCCI